MADGIKIEIVSPERLVVSQQALSVTVPGAEGYFTIMGDHAPLMSTLKPGFITVTDMGNIAHVYYVRGGFADVAPAGLTILAEQARPVADFNRTEIEALIATGQTALQAASTAADQDRLTNDLDAWKNLLLDAAVSRDTTH
ncbi:MAG: F0F1 ATP synthase subunit epsilon [Devosia sp.]